MYRTKIFNIMGEYLDINTNIKEIKVIFDEMFESCVTQHADITEIYITKEVGFYKLKIYGRVSEKFSSLINLWEALKYRIFFENIWNKSAPLLFHAGVVQKNGKGVIICGPAGSGKTTLTLEMLQKGYKYVGEEICPLNCSKGLFEINPFPIALRNSDYKIPKNCRLISKKIYEKFQKEKLYLYTAPLIEKSNNAIKPVAVIYLSRSERLKASYEVLDYMKGFEKMLGYSYTRGNKLEQKHNLFLAKKIFKDNKFLNFYSGELNNSVSLLENLLEGLTNE